MRTHAAAFLCDVEARPDLPEASVAHRVLGSTHWFAGEYEKARDHLERALALFQPGRDDDLAFRFGQDASVTVMAFLACVLWPLGEVDRACGSSRKWWARATQRGHIATIVWGHYMSAQFELMRGRPARAARHVTAMIGIARDHGMRLWLTFGGVLEPWVRSHSGGDASVEKMRRGIVMLEKQGVSLFAPLFETALAAAEAAAGKIETALETLDRAITETERTGQRWYEPETHRIRGEILLKRDPASPALAEEALQTAIAIARRQKARSFELRAALSLAKLYQSTGRPADAHAVLALALEGFSPTPEMPEIAEAQALLAALTPE